MTTEHAKVVGHRVLLEPVFVENQTEWGFKLDIGETFEREKASTILGKVVSIGPTAWFAFDRYLPNGSINPDWEPWAKIGDRVFFAKFGGKFIKLNNKDYVIVNDEDVQGIYYEEENND